MGPRDERCRKLLELWELGTFQDHGDGAAANFRQPEQRLVIERRLPGAALSRPRSLWTLPNLRS